MGFVFVSLSSLLPFPPSHSLHGSRPLEPGSDDSDGGRSVPGHLRRCRHAGAHGRLRCGRSTWSARERFVRSAQPQHACSQIPADTLHEFLAQHSWQLHCIHHPGHPPVERFVTDPNYKWIQCRWSPEAASLFWDNFDDRTSEQEAAYRLDQQAAKKAGKWKTHHFRLALPLQNLIQAAAKTTADHWVFHVSPSHPPLQLGLRHSHLQALKEKTKGRRQQTFVHPAIPKHAPYAQSLIYMSMIFYSSIPVPLADSFRFAAVAQG